MWPEQPGYCALHFAMKLGMMPKRAPISFARGLEQDRAVGRLERLGEQDRRLVDAGAGLGVQALDRDAERAPSRRTAP